MSPNMNTQALRQLVDQLRNIQLADGIDGKFVWCWEGDGLFSARSAYRAHFAARIESAGAMEIRKSRAPATCKFFSWLAAQKRCWTTDKLQQRLLPHPAACPFCNQEPETINHLLLGCVLARQIWSVIMGNWGNTHWTPQPELSWFDGGLR